MFWIPWAVFYDAPALNLKKWVCYGSYSLLFVISWFFIASFADSFSTLFTVKKSSWCSVWQAPASWTWERSLIKLVENTRLPINFLWYLMEYLSFYWKSYELLLIIYCSLMQWVSFWHVGLGLYLKIKYLATTIAESDSYSSLTSSYCA